MSAKSKLMLSRQQLTAFLSDPDSIRAFERVFAMADATENAPGIFIPIVPISAAPSGNVVYSTLPVGPGLFTIEVPVAALKASAGGPFTLTLSTGVAGKATVVVPIAKSTDTIDSGPLLFDVEVDAAGNVTSKGWTSLSGHNANGSYVMFADGTARAWISTGVINVDTNYTAPIAFTQILGVSGSCVPVASWSTFDGYMTSNTNLLIHVFAAGNAYTATIDGRWK